MREAEIGQLPGFDSDLAELEAEGLRREIFVCPESLINLSSNDYLGLSNHPDVIKAGREALERFGAGGTSSRLLAGTRKPHEELEEDLARFLGKETALVYSSGYHANTGILPALASSGDLILFDRLCHASIIDGIRLSSARFFSFEHNSLADLEKKLIEKRPSYRRTFIVTEGIFSMDGDRSPIPALANLSRRFDSLLYVDEAHSFGVFGPDGRGLAAEVGALQDIPIFVGTLSKALGSQGGFVACDGNVRDLLVSRSRSFLYSTSLAPACAAAARESLRLLPKLEERRARIHRASIDLRRRLVQFGFSVLESSSQIIPVWAGDVETTNRMSAHLFKSGFFVPSIRPPTVPPGEGRVRISVAHDAAAGGIEKIAAAFKNFGERPARRREKIVQGV